MKDISSELLFRRGTLHSFLAGLPNQTPRITYHCHIDLHPRTEPNYGEHHPAILLEGFASNQRRFTDIKDLSLAPGLHNDMHASIYLENHYDPDEMTGTLSYDHGRFFEMNVKLKLQTPAYMAIEATVDGTYQFRIPYGGLIVDPNRFFPKPDTIEAVTALAEKFVDLDLYLPPRTKDRRGWKFSAKPRPVTGA